MSYTITVHKINDCLMNCDREEYISHYLSDWLNFENPCWNKLHYVAQPFQLHPFTTTFQSSNSYQDPFLKTSFTILPSPLFQFHLSFEVHKFPHSFLISRNLPISIPSTLPQFPFLSHPINSAIPPSTPKTISIHFSVNEASTVYQWVWQLNGI